MSRARHSSHVHAIADSPDQAAEDLTRDWTSERRQIWAIDTGTPQRADRPAVGPLQAEADPTSPIELRASLARARLSAERAALAATLQADPPDNPHAALHRLQQLDRRLRPLNHHLGAPAPRRQAARHDAPPESPTQVAEPAGGPEL
jgi:hypothetical protein